MEDVEARNAATKLKNAMGCLTRDRIAKMIIHTRAKVRV